MLIDLYTKDGSQSGQIELRDDIFAIEPNENAMHMAVVGYLAHQRQGTRKTKTRADVSGGGKKPWRQKGRGTARSGSSRSPVWVGGGTIHGPKPQDFVFKVPKKVKRLARNSALSLRAAEKNILIVEDFSLTEAKTKEMASVLNNLKLSGQKTLIMMTNYDYNIYLSARNIENVSIYPVDKVSTYDILCHKKLLLFKGAVEAIEKNFQS
jgi:large subunit ribosomal protein L4